ncbi:hypothetical protein [Streptomyces sp. NPDC048496]|uniref:hypothetical protein n=1 Tax=Streptomyces sp. NPDC048496 TaxID=3365558 RepID=UPI00371F2329
MPVLSVGDYTVTVTKFGYLKTTGDVKIIEGQTTTSDFAVEQVPTAKVSGTATSSAGPEAKATVAVTGTTDDQGRYELTLPLGKHDLRVSS